MYQQQGTYFNGSSQMTSQVSGTMRSQVTMQAATLGGTS